MRTISFAVLAAVLCGMTLSASAETFYKEDFQKLGNCAPGVTVARGEIGVSNEPCWEGYFAMWVRAKKDMLVWTNGIPVGKGDFDFSFEFENNSPKGFALVLGNEKLTVTNGVKQGWGALQLKKRGPVADLYVMKNRVYEKIVTGFKVPAGIETVNLFAPAESNFNLKNVLSESARNGFVIDSSVKRIYADYASLQQPFNGNVCKDETAVEIPANAARARLRLQLGAGAIAAVYEDFDKEGNPHLVTNAFSVTAEEGIGDCKLNMPGLATRYVRPFLFPFGSRAYGNPIPEMTDLKRDWRETPGASNHVVTVEFVRNGGKQQLWIDGSFVKTLKTEKPYTFILKNGAKYELSTPVVGNPRFVSLDFAANPKAKTFARGNFVGVRLGPTLFDSVPVNICSPLDSQDIAICHQAKGAWALEVEEYFSNNRSPLTGFPSESHFLVPAALYSQIGLVFALDPDPSKDAVLTLTFGRYAGEVGGNKIVQKTLDFSKGVPDCGRKIGSVEVGGKAVPLYYALVPVDLGKILDFTAGDYMDVEFTGKLWENFQQDDKSMRPDPKSRSAFNVFAATLVKSGVRAETVLSAPGNVYTVDARPKKTAFKVTGTEGGTEGNIVCVVRDDAGKEVKTIDKPFKLADGEATTLDLDYTNFGQGWYEVVWSITNATGTLVSHEGALAVLPAPGRNLTKEKSPYATWLFMGTHGAPTNKVWAGRLLQMAGIRKATLEKEYADKFDITSIGNAYAPKERDVMGTNFEALVIANIKKAIEKEPFLDHVMLWHESAPGGEDQYYELLGLPVPPPNETAKRRNERVAKYVTETGRIVHKHFPNLRLQIGNTSASMGAVTYPMRGGVDWSVFDSIGLESPSQMVPPERYTEVGLLGLLGPQTLASKAAGRKIPVNGCYEFIYRSERDIGQPLQGEYQARDIVICLAHGFTLISPGIFFDCSSGYYNGLWGGSGIMKRGPWCYPKRAYVAYAVATKVLDGVTFEKMLDTGSSTVYAAQFKRQDGKTVTAVWCVRGTFDFDFTGPAELISLYGGKGAKKGSGAMTYVISDKPLEGFTVSNRAFPFEEGIFRDAPFVCEVSAEKFTLDPDPVVASTTHSFMPQLKPGEFETDILHDDERGYCLELTLKSDPAKTTSFWTEYTTIRFDKPIDIPGEPVLLGAEIKGNSNWGQIRFEIEDADGEVFKNVSTGDDWGCDIMDWPGRLAVAFDGWSWVCQSLHKNTILPDHSPATYEEQWQSQGGDKVIRYPIKLRAITVGMNRDKTTLFGFEPSDPKICIKSIRAIPGQSAVVERHEQ